MPPVFVSDIVAGANSSSPSGMTEVNGKLYFTATNGTDGRELWVLDINNAPVVANAVAEPTAF